MKIAENINQKIFDFVRTDPGNRLPDGRAIFDLPLIGYADAEDSLFSDFRRQEVVGPSFCLPQNWLPGAVTVVSYFLPFSEPIRLSNYGGPPPSEEWLHGRFIGEKFNLNLRRYILKELENRGGSAVAPALHPDYKSDYDNLTSNWSERHVAFAAGLGSFGLSGGLITEKGKAGRFGSIITDLKIPPTPKPSSNPFQNCPYYDDQSCGFCIERCPAGSISSRGNDKAACFRYSRTEDHLKSLREKFGYDHSVCGKCQVDVPCEDRIP